jgi:hypothetical protein
MVMVMVMVVVVVVVVVVGPTSEAISTLLIWRY